MCPLLLGIRDDTLMANIHVKERVGKTGTINLQANLGMRKIIEAWREKAAACGVLLCKASIRLSVLH